MTAPSFHTDPDLLRKIAAGDSAAFEVFFLQAWDYVYGIAIRLTKSPEIADDLAQEIFIRLWNNRARLVDLDNFPAFLYTVSRNLVYDHLRNKVFREENMEELRRYFSTDAEAPDFMERKEQREQLNDAIGRLSPQLKAVFTLSYLEGLNHTQIAERLGITPVSSRVFLARAVSRLRKMLLPLWWLFTALKFFFTAMLTF
ncbi:RNA polymerase sigma factor [Parasegetibacter sp. NRK P23]|uniref:RNA polymerase sigma factor n=1 Tax=Parasegetibacter sp. NRK P23 TaxID=2942999 RepID=UPI002042EA85|nr:sigma-70 family RNA polymerase sigma factor [Parasegetibacter sp. NRK P23]MCM5527917.1 sigma-70 family RNA polymerase sigma factor [Parasegetibacter sp. NRK P23]